MKFIKSPPTQKTQSLTHWFCSKQIEPQRQWWSEISTQIVGQRIQECKNPHNTQEPLKQGNKMKKNSNQA